MTDNLLQLLDSVIEEETSASTKISTLIELLDFVTRKINTAHGSLKDLSLDIVSLGPWSSSKQKVLEKCPFQFYLKYVLKIKMPETVSVLKDDSLSADVGTTAHRILEHSLKGKSVQDSFELAKKEFVGYKLTQDQWAELVLPLELSIINFQDRIEKLDRDHKIKRVLTELRIGLTREFEATGFFANDVWYRGVIDLVLMLENNDAIIIDHKTGGGQGSIKYYESQLDTYKILFHHGTNKVNGIQTGIHFIAASEVKMASFSSAEEIETKLKDRLEWDLQGTIDRVKELGYFKHVRGPYCKWCEFDAVGCKSGELKPIELDTRKFFSIKPIA